MAGEFGWGSAHDRPERSSICSRERVDLPCFERFQSAILVCADRDVGDAVAIDIAEAGNGRAEALRSCLAAESMDDRA